MANTQPPKEPLPEHPLPPPDFNNRPLPVTECQTSWYRLNPIQHLSALYFAQSGRSLWLWLTLTWTGEKLPRF